MTTSEKQYYLWKFLIPKNNKNFLLMILKNSFEENFELERIPITICSKFYNRDLLIETIFLILPFFNFYQWYLNNDKINNKIIYEKIELSNHIKKSINIKSNVLKINTQKKYTKRNNNKHFFIVEKIENDYIYLKNSDELIPTPKKLGIKFSTKNKLRYSYVKKRTHLKNVKEIKNDFIFKNKNFTNNNKIFIYLEGKKTIFTRSNASFEIFIKTLNIKLHDILYFNSNKFGSIVSSYNKESLYILETNGLSKKIDISSIFFYNRIEKKNRKNLNKSFDYQFNIIFTGETVKIVSGLYLNYDVNIKFIQLDYLYAFSNKILINNGLLCLKSENVKCIF